MSALFTLNGASEFDPAVEEWLSGEPEHLFSIARHWFALVRRCGEDVRELMHDGHATACIEDVAFAYVGVFRNHVNVGFFHGAELDDPAGLLEGSGKRMRHVKLQPEEETDRVALAKLISDAYGHVKKLL